MTTTLAARVRALSAERRRALDLMLAEAGLLGPNLPILPRSAPGADRVRASFAQRRLWFQEQLDPANPAYTIFAAVRLDGPLDVPALERALAEVERRHETLRTTFAFEDGETWQVIHPPAGYALPVEELSPGAGEAEIRGRALAEARAPFDLTRRPLWRATLLRLAPDAHVLLLAYHHIVADGWSMGILVAELTELYRAGVAGEPARLPELAVQYADFAEWQRGWLTDEVVRAQLGYWRRQLDPLPSPLEWRRLVGTTGATATAAGEGARHHFALPPELARRVGDLALALHTTPFVVLLSGFASLLRWASGQDDLAIGTDLAARNSAEIERMIGFFVNQTVLPARLCDDPTFAATVARLREATLGALAHQDVPFERLVEAVQPKRTGRAPLFQAKFVLQNAPMPAALGVGALRVTPFEVDPGGTKFDLLVNMAEAGGTLGGTIEYTTVVLDAAAVERLAARFAAVLDLATADPALRQSGITAALDALEARSRTAARERLAQGRRDLLRRAQRRAASAATAPHGA